MEKGSQGLSILRGDSGTGKTYFIRHLISRLRETHIFYLINLSDFDLLTSPNMVEFWSTEVDGDCVFSTLSKSAKKKRKKMKRVIIIEDASSKNIVKKRMCRSGMRWDRQKGKAGLTLRTIAKSGQWNQVRKSYYDFC